MTKKITEGIKVDPLDSVRCPHCNALSEEEVFMNDETYTCESCNKDYSVLVEFTVFKEE